MSTATPLTPNPAAPPAAAASSTPPPGPKKKFPLGDLPQMRGDRIGFLSKQFQTYGDVSIFHIGPVPVVFAVGPDAVERVLQANARNYTKKTPGFDAVRQLLGQGLLTSDGDFWLRQRRLAQPAFHRERLAKFADLMVTASESIAGEFTSGKPGAPVDVGDGMMRLALRIVSEALFGEDLDKDARTISDALTVALEAANERITQAVKIPSKIPTPMNVRANRAHKALDEVVFRLIDRRRKDGAVRHDLLSMLMEAKDEDTGETMSDTQLRDEVMTLLLAGHETSANSLTWTLGLLSRHPDVRRKLQAELDTVLAGRRPTLEDMSKLVYTRQVVDEGLRLYPPAWAFSRRSIAPDTLQGFAIPKDQIVFLSPYTTHRHPKYWENPEGFDPDRFTPEKVKARPRFAYFPFSGGPRQCIGNMFALMELTFALAVLCQKVRLDLLPGQTLEPHATITVRPAGGLWMNVS